LHRPERIFRLLYLRKTEGKERSEKKKEDRTKNCTSNQIAVARRRKRKQLKICLKVGKA